MSNSFPENSLLNEFNTAFDAAPFDLIQVYEFKPAFDYAIFQAKNEIEKIVSNLEEPTFENTVEALEFSGMKLDRISSIFFNLNSAETNEEMQALAQEISPELSNFSNDIYQNAALFKRVEAVYKNAENLNLNGEQKELLLKKYQGFVRNGALLEQFEKNALRQIDVELSKLSLTFSENLLKETQEFFLQIKEKSDLSGLPDFVVEAAREEAQQRKLEGWVFTLDYPSYIPFVTYADNRELRKKMTIAFGAKGFKNNSFDNQENVRRIAKLRLERANLLGFANHAEYVLQERMAQTPKNVIQFLDNLLDKALPAAEQELKELTQFAKEKDGIEKLQKWDSTYYSEKWKKERFNLNDELLKPYFELNSVLNGAFLIAEKLFGLKFELNLSIPVYHPDVKTYEVMDEEGRFLALFYADFHPRKGKRAGAWMTSFKSQYKKDEKNIRPHVAIVCNFTKPTISKPSLLTFNEVTTLFHEFGHALHGMLADTTYPSLSGTNVFWDFVELPSQLMENWCYEAEALSLFAKHYETGETIPMEYIEKIKESANFLEGMATVRQLSFGLLDMAFHGENSLEINSVKAYELKAMEKASLFPDVVGNCMSTQFSHIFAGGYAAGYYSYKWAEVLDADAFEFFKEKGILNREIGELFQSTILSKGGTVHPMELYKCFTEGHEPSVDALLKRAGLLKK